jgi:hypothetical protein
MIPERVVVGVWVSSVEPDLRKFPAFLEADCASQRHRIVVGMIMSERLFG